MKFTRNESHWTNESEYNDWAVHNVIVIMDNTEHLYKAYQNCIKQNMNRLLYRMVLDVMQSENIKVKQKNIHAVMNELKENYKHEIY